jgi:hypothetical protein
MWGDESTESLRVCFNQRCFAAFYAVFYAIQQTSTFWIMRVKLVSFPPAMATENEVVNHEILWFFSKKMRPTHRNDSSPILWQGFVRTGEPFMAISALEIE